MLHREHEHNPDPRNAWFAFGVLMLIGALGLLWLNEQVKPRELFAPHYEEDPPLPEESDSIT